MNKRRLRNELLKIFFLFIQNFIIVISQEVYPLHTFVKIAGTGPSINIATNSPSAIELNSVSGIATDLTSSIFYISDTNNNVIRVLNQSNTLVSTLCGNGTEFSGDYQQLSKATLRKPSSLNYFNNAIFFIDNAGLKIRKIDLKLNLITTIFNASQNQTINDIAYHISFNSLFISYSGPLSQILLLNLTSLNSSVFVNQNGNISLLTYGGSSLQAKINNPVGLAIDQNENLLYFSDNGNDVIRLVDLTSGLIKTIAGGGYSTLIAPGQSFPFYFAYSRSPSFISLDSLNQLLYISDSLQIFELNLTSNLIQVIANFNSTKGPPISDNFAAFSGQFNEINQIYYGQQSKILYICDSGSNRVFKLDISSNGVNTLVGKNVLSIGDNGNPLNATFNFDTDQPNNLIVLNQKDGSLIISDFNNDRIRKIFQNKIVPFAGSTSIDPSIGDGGSALLAKINPTSIFFDNQNNLFLSDQGNGRIRVINSTTGMISTLNFTPFPINYFSFNNKTNILYIGMQSLTQLFILQVSLSNLSQIDLQNPNSSNILIQNSNPNNTTPVENGKTIDSFITYSKGFVVDSINNLLYIPDKNYQRIRKIDLNTTFITTICGNGQANSLGDDGPAINATVFFPSLLALDLNKNLLYFVEDIFVIYFKIRKIDLNSGVITKVTEINNTIYNTNQTAKATFTTELKEKNNNENELKYKLSGKIPEEEEKNKGEYKLKENLLEKHIFSSEINNKNEEKEEEKKENQYELKEEILDQTLISNFSLEEKENFVDSFTVKIADFGLSRILQNHYYTTSSNMVPIKWSPEVLEKRKFSIQSDIWSFGIVLWEIFSCGKEPYNKLNNVQTFQKVVCENYKLPNPNENLCSFEIYSLMIDCWKNKPNERPNFQEIYQRLK